MLNSSTLNILKAMVTEEIPVMAIENTFVTKLRSPALHDQYVKGNNYQGD